MPNQEFCEIDGAVISFMIDNILILITEKRLYCYNFFTEAI